MEFSRFLLFTALLASPSLATFLSRFVRQDQEDQRPVKFRLTGGSLRPSEEITFVPLVAGDYVSKLQEVARPGWRFIGQGTSDFQTTGLRRSIIDKGQHPPQYVRTVSR